MSMVLWRRLRRLNGGTPWRIGTVKLDEGPAVLAHIHDDVRSGARVKMIPNPPMRVASQVLWQMARTAGDA